LQRRISTIRAALVLLDPKDKTGHVEHVAAGSTNIDSLLMANAACTDEIKVFFTILGPEECENIR
jgi:hypothetical protein